MSVSNLKFVLLPVALTALAGGCVTKPVPAVAHFQTGESLVLVDEKPGRLAFAISLSDPVAVRSTYRADLPQTVQYEDGRDYVFTAAGEIRRTANSRIPNFGTNILYGKEDFNHSQFPGYGNNPFFVYVDYHHRETWQPPAPRAEFSAAALPRTRRKLAAGESVRIVAYGDSITAGGEASEPGLIFWARWTEALRQKYPRAQIEAINGATGGDTTAQGLQRLDAKVLAQKPDLVLIGFGMNDHNRAGFGVPLPQFAANLRALVDRIRTGSKAEVVLYSAFPPNPKWHFGSHNMAAYAATTEQVAREMHCAFADVFGYWQQMAERKQPEDLLGNNINHPNDFGHGIYFAALEGLGL